MKVKEKKQERDTNSIQFNSIARSSHSHSSDTRASAGIQHLLPTRMCLTRMQALLVVKCRGEREREGRK